MSQEPNIDTSKIPTKADLPMPVPRRLSNRPAENINPNSEEVFGNTGPDSGFALKIVNKYKKTHTKNIGDYRASKCVVIPIKELFTEGCYKI